MKALFLLMLESLTKEPRGPISITSSICLTSIPSPQRTSLGSRRQYVTPARSSKEKMESQMLSSCLKNQST